jgi:hypothetical protein
MPPQVKLGGPSSRHDTGGLYASVRRSVGCRGSYPERGPVPTTFFHPIFTRSSHPQPACIGRKLWSCRVMLSAIYHADFKSLASLLVFFTINSFPLRLVKNRSRRHVRPILALFNSRAPSIINTVVGDCPVQSSQCYSSRKPGGIPQPPFYLQTTGLETTFLLLVNLNVMLLEASAL